MVGRLGCWLALLWLGAATSLRAEALGWQEAVARLRQERGQAVLCAGVLKRHAAGGALEQGALDYGQAKSEYDAVIAGLQVALASGRSPASLPDLDARLSSGFERRTALCDLASHVLPSPENGNKGIGDEIVKATVGPVVEAALKLLDEAIHGPPGRRDTIRTQLDATAWPDFATVSPQP